MTTATRRLEELSRSASGVPILFAVWCLWLTLPYWCLGSYSYVQIHDNADQMFSVLVAYSHGVASPGLWAGAWATGVDWLAQAYTNNLYAIPFFFLPAWLAISVVMFAQRFIAGYFMFRLMKHMEVDNPGCWYAGLAYSLFLQLFSPGFTLFKGLAEAGFPLVVWAIVRTTRSSARLYVSAFGIGIIYALCSSFHLSCFAFILLPIWLLLFDNRKQLRGWMATGFLGAGWLLAEIPAIAATGLNAGASHRSDWNPSLAFGGFSMAVQEVAGIFKYNLLSLIILVLAIVLMRYRGKYRAWLVAVLGCSAAPVIWFVVNTHFHSKLGFLSGFGWGRVHMLVPFLAISAAAISGVGLSRYHIGRVPLTHIMGAATLVVVLQSALLNASIFHAVADGSNYAEFYRNSDLEALAKELRAATSPYRVASLGIHPGFMWAYGLETADGYLNLYPKRYQNFWQAVNQEALRRDSRLQSYFRNYGNRIYLFVPDGNPAGALNLLNSATTSVRFSELFNLNLLSLANVRYIISTVPLDDPDLTLRPSSIRQGQIDWQKKSRLARYLDVLRHRVPGVPLYIYENRKVMPRFFFPTHIITMPEKEAIGAMEQLSADQLQEKVFVAQPMQSTAGSDNSRAISIKSYGASCISLQATCGAACALFIADNYSPYWTALVDGNRTSLRLADGTFQAIDIPPGQHNIELQYSPPYAPFNCPN